MTDESRPQADVRHPQGAIESIAETLCDRLGDDGSAQCPYDAIARRILDALAADGYSVVRIETSEMFAAPTSFWEPVPEGSEDD